MVPNHRKENTGNQQDKQKEEKEVMDSLVEREEEKGAEGENQGDWRSGETEKDGGKREQEGEEESPAQNEAA